MSFHLSLTVQVILKWGLLHQTGRQVPLWHRKIGGRQGSVRSSHQTVSRVSKISFSFHFWHKSFIFDDVKFAELSNNGFEWKNDFVGGWQGDKTCFDPFFRGQDPQPSKIYAPGSDPQTLRWIDATGMKISGREITGCGTYLRECLDSDQAARPSWRTEMW